MRRKDGQAAVTFSAESTRRISDEICPHDRVTAEFLDKTAHVCYRL